MLIKYTGKYVNIYFIMKITCEAVNVGAHEVWKLGTYLLFKKNCAFQ